MYAEVNQELVRPVQVQPRGLEANRQRLIRAALRRLRTPEELDL